MTDELKACREAFEKWMEKTQPFHAQGTRGMAMWEAYQDAWQQSRTKPEGVDIGHAVTAIQETCRDKVSGYGMDTGAAEIFARACAISWHLTAKE